MKISFTRTGESNAECSLGVEQFFLSFSGVENVCGFQKHLKIGKWVRYENLSRPIEYAANNQPSLSAEPGAIVMLRDKKSERYKKCFNNIIIITNVYKDEQWQLNGAPKKKKKI